MLTAEQKAHFETFGFLLMKQYFSPQEMSEIIRHFDEALAEDRQGQPFDWDKRQGIFAAVEKRMPWLLEDDRIYLVIEELLGPGVVWIGSDSNLYVGDTCWHPDGSDMTFGRIKVVFYLDPVTKDTGCLRVIPGSHKPPLNEDLKPLRENPLRFGVEQRDIPCYPLESQPGDVVFFNQNTWHASFGGRSGRRMFTMNFGAKPITDEHLAYLRRAHQGNLDFQKKHSGAQTGRIYTDEFLYSDRPRIKAIVSKLVELGLK